MPNITEIAPPKKLTGWIRPFRAVYVDLDGLDIGGQHVRGVARGAYEAMASPNI